MAVAILINGREDEIQMFMLGFCSDGNLGTGPFPGDPNFLQVTFPAVSPGANQPCTLFQEIIADNNCFVSINGLTSGDCLIVPTAGGGTACIPMDDVAGVAVQVPSADPVFTTLVGVAMDVSLCSGNGFWTRGPSNSQISFPGPVILYHELIGHGLHFCRGDFNASNPELGQAIPEENILRGVLGLPQRTAHEGGCAAGGDSNCYIATAAYGGQIAPEVHELRKFRDTVLRSTTWGSEFFDEFYKYYFTFSPAIAAMMVRDPRMMEIIRASLVHPLMIALRLFLALPDDPQDTNEAQKFARRACDEFGQWIKQLPLAASAASQSPGILANDIIKLLDLSHNSKLREAFFDNLLSSDTFPLKLEGHSFRKIEGALLLKGVKSNVIERLIKKGDLENG